MSDQPIAIITGSGTYALGGLEDAESVTETTPWGEAELTAGRLGDTPVLHLPRHGEGHARLSNTVNHRAGIWALHERGAAAVIGCTACGAVDPQVGLGDLIVFDDLHFLSNRLPDGSLATFYTEAGDPQRGHWILGDPYSVQVRQAVVAAAGETDHTARDGGTYGHVDGPRFNTKTEIRQLAGSGVTAVSQTGGPETALCGELELPYALVGFATDYANGVVDEATPVEELIALMSKSTGVFSDVLRKAVPALTAAEPKPGGTVYRFEG